MKSSRTTDIFSIPGGLEMSCSCRSRARASSVGEVVFGVRFLGFLSFLPFGSFFFRCPMSDLPVLDLLGSHVYSPHYSRPGQREKESLYPQVCCRQEARLFAHLGGLLEGIR